MPLPTNQAAQTANTIIKSIEQGLEPMIEKIIIAQVPALGLPVIKQITDEIETVVENEIAKYLEIGTDFVIYDLQTTSENNDLASARAAYVAAINSGNQSAILAARKVFDAAQDALAASDGSGTLQ